MRIQKAEGGAGREGPGGGGPRMNAGDADRWGAGGGTGNAEFRRQNSESETRAGGIFLGVFSGLVLGGLGGGDGRGGEQKEAKIGIRLTCWLLREGM
jgi:hypothetical protein